MGIDLPSTESAIYRIGPIEREGVHSAIADIADVFGQGRVDGNVSAHTLKWCHSELTHAFARVISAVQPSAVRGGIERRRILNRVEEYLSIDSLAPLRMDAVCLAAGTTSNWLPAPEGTFSLYIRAYWPDKEIVEGSWKTPVVEMVK